MDHEDGSVTLPEALADEVVRRLAHYDQLPALHRAELASRRRQCDADLDAALRGCMADRLEESADAGVVSAQRWPTWLVAVLVGGGIAAGLGTGIAIGLVLAD